MPYCTQEDIEKLVPLQELVELTTDSGDEVDAAVVDEAIAKADAEIDSYLGRRYALPFAVTPPRVKSLSVDMASYHLYSRRSGVPEVREQNYKNAVDFLAGVAAGQAAIMDGGEEIIGIGREASVIRSERRVFSRQTLHGF